MTVFHSIILGIIQGLGEFLPISSSAHLIVVPWILGWDDGGLTFDVALHGGTLVALLIYFRHEWIRLGKAFVMRKPEPDFKMALYILVATIPGAIMGKLLEEKAEHAFRDPRLIASTLAIMGVVLWWADRRGKKTLALEQDMTWGRAISVGIAQGFAIIPGFSRSGVTISTSLVQGFNRTDCARFSFFLSMPIILGACILKLRHLTGADLTPAFMAGVAASAISGYFAIGGLIRYLQTRSYGVFAVYRVLAGIAIWIIVAFRHGG